MSRVLTESDVKELLKTLPQRCYSCSSKEEVPNYRRPYTGWGVGEDYMYTDEKSGWSASMKVDTWKSFYNNDLENKDPWSRSGAEEWDIDLNLVADFYFYDAVEKELCKDCEGDGYNPETKKIADDFYSFNGGTAWRNKITQDEVQALIDNNRLHELTHVRVGDKWVASGYIPTADEVNALNEPGAKGFGHDAINRCILVETRAKRLGVYGRCSTCGGEGSVEISPHKLGLMVWLLHPRKGASRGLQIKEILPEEIPEVCAFLKRSWEKHVLHWRWVWEKMEKPMEFPDEYLTID